MVKPKLLYLIAICIVTVSSSLWADVTPTPIAGAAGTEIKSLNVDVLDIDSPEKNPVTAVSFTLDGITRSATYDPDSQHASGEILYTELVQKFANAVHHFSNLAIAITYQDGSCKQYSSDAKQVTGVGNVNVALGADQLKQSQSVAIAIST